MCVGPYRRVCYVRPVVVEQHVEIVTAAAAVAAAHQCRVSTLARARRCRRRTASRAPRGGGETCNVGLTGKKKKKITAPIAQLLSLSTLRPFCANIYTQHTHNNNNNNNYDTRALFCNVVFSGRRKHTIRDHYTRRYNTCIRVR